MYRKIIIPLYYLLISFYLNWDKIQNKVLDCISSFNIYMLFSYIKMTKTFSSSSDQAIHLALCWYCKKCKRKVHYQTHFTDLKPPKWEIEMIVLYLRISPRYDFSCNMLWLLRYLSMLLWFNAHWYCLKNCVFDMCMFSLKHNSFILRCITVHYLKWIRRKTKIVLLKFITQRYLCDMVRIPYELISVEDAKIVR